MYTYVCIYICIYIHIARTCAARVQETGGRSANWLNHHTSPSVTAKAPIMNASVPTIDLRFDHGHFCVPQRRPTISARPATRIGV